MKSFQRKITVIALTMLFSNMASATPINGKVADAVTGEAIIGASVIYNNKVGAVTDVEGRFHLDIASFPSDISVSYVGYESLRVKISLMSGIGAPVAILGIILPIYTIIDMVETAENVWSDSCVSAMVDRDLH